jgi:6-phosphogluconate dehydrogenase
MTNRSWSKHNHFVDKLCFDGEKDNSSLYGEHYKFQDNSFATSVTEITQKIAVIMNDNVENAIIDKIIQEAKQEGVTDLFILNKQAIMEAIKKQIPAKAIPHKVDVEKIKIRGVNWCKNTTIYKCPCCDDFISITNKHCHECGQALDWGDTE